MSLTEYRWENPKYKVSANWIKKIIKINTLWLMSFSLGMHERYEVFKSVSVTQHINWLRGNGSMINSVDVG